MSELYIGIMSGTSLDAIDAVVTAIDANTISLVATYEHPFPAALRQQLLPLCSGQHTTLAEVGLIDHQLGKLYAAAVSELLSQAQLRSEEITALGNHGQTVFHQPGTETPFTIQLGDANLIAVLTGIDTVADFRRIDMALGGQGAPLAPAFHEFLFRQPNSSTVVLNIGGISNLSVIPVHGNTIGFDTGPGNILMDSWCEKHTGLGYDKDAQWAETGDVNTELLNRLMADPYLTKMPPKSTGREYFNVHWLHQLLHDTLPPEDVQRTLCEFTALSIVNQLTPFKEGKASELLVCGGGARNPLLMRRIQQLSADWHVVPTDDRGIPGDYMEAMAFAWLARQRMHDQPSNLPSVTGAKRAASLGVLYPAI